MGRTLRRGGLKQEMANLFHLATPLPLPSSLRAPWMVNQSPGLWNADVPGCLKQFIGTETAYQGNLFTVVSFGFPSCFCPVTVKKGSLADGWMMGSPSSDAMEIFPRMRDLVISELVGLFPRSCSIAPVSERQEKTPHADYKSFNATQFPS